VAETLQVTEGDARESHPAASCLAALVRIATGVRVRWEGCEPVPRQRIYFANHTSHLDAVVLWGALPSALRARTRPVAGRDYWEHGALRRWLAGEVFRVVLVDRATPAGTGRAEAARRTIDALVLAMRAGDSLIVFPEGTRGDGVEIGPFKSGIYHLAARMTGVELVPAYLENLNRILPKGEVLPVPLAGSVVFGPPIVLGEGEEKQAFVARAREAVRRLRPVG
jgi:1-acyl-sn-glycerol-3-phosphate acyltransferase